ncbi:MAG TPA: hypothetical protein EYM84_02645 [Flavobacteriales bacterium]|nr:hypothetical protein [Flavobacteriales bacterium]HIN39154.1 hypothetical protein [Flavobacteriales bacterium]
MKITKINFAMLIICFIHYSALSVAGGDNHALSARSTALGGAGVTLLDLWAVHYNQAGLAGIEAITAGVYYENRFALKELSVKGAALALPLPGKGQNVLGVSMSYFGYSEYNDSKVGLAYGKKLGDKYSVGIQLNYLQTKIGRDYGSYGAFAAEAGLRAELIDNLSMGVHIYNPTRTSILEYDIQEETKTERIPTIMRFGLSYSFSDKVMVVAETEKDIYFDHIFKAGIEYRPIKILYIRGGIASDPLYNTFGFGIEQSSFILDFAASKHQVLGYTTQISLAYKFNKKKTKFEE